MCTDVDKLGKLLSRACIFMCKPGEQTLLQHAESLDGTDGDHSVVQTGGARPSRIFVFETINTPGAPFFRAPSVGLTLLTWFAAPAVSETLKPKIN